jgi:hypothetical protein
MMDQKVNTPGHFETLKGPQSMWDQLMLYSQKHQVQKKGFLGGGKCSPRPSCRLTDFAASSIAKNSLKRSKQCQSKSGRSLALTDFATSQKQTSSKSCRLTDFATSQKQASSKSCRLTDFASPGQQSKSPRAKTPSMKLTQFASPVSTKKSATPWRQADGPAPWNKGKFVKHGKVSPAIVAPPGKTLKWECDKCQRILEASDSAKLGILRSTHISTAHPGWSGKDFHQILQFQPAVVEKFARTFEVLHSFQQCVAASNYQSCRGSPSHVCRTKFHHAEKPLGFGSPKA